MQNFEDVPNNMSTESQRKFFTNIKWKKKMLLQV